MIIEHKGRSYRVTDGAVEVFVPVGAPRVMQLVQRASYWRTLKPNGLIARQVRILAERITDKEQHS
jgi:hypothetical protein